MPGGGPGASIPSPREPSELASERTLGSVIETQDAPATRPDPAPMSARWWAGRVPFWAILVATLLVGLPLIVAVARLHGRPWHPVLDLAMTEFRVRDVFTGHTPLIGLPGRIGTYPAQGSHPGPLSFYLLAPTYRALGQSSWSMEVGTVLIHLARHRHRAVADGAPARLGRAGRRRGPVRPRAARLRPGHR